MAEFKISRFKYTWRNTWITGTEYLIDDIIRYGTRTYVCVAPHTSDEDFYADLEDSTPKWVLMSQGTTWKNEWQISTDYFEGDVVKFGGSVYLCVNSHTSIADETTFLLDADNWTTFIFSVEWLNDWSSTVFYKVGSVIKLNSIIYQCIVEHTSSDSFLDDIDNWELLLLDEKWHGNFQLDVFYTQGTIVRRGGTIYVANESHVAIGAFESDKFDIVHQGIEYKGNFVAGTTYLANDVVKRGGFIYKAKEEFLSADFDIENWDVLTPGQMFERTWSDLTSYQQGDIVRYGGLVYVANAENLDDNPTTGTSWNLLFPGYNIRGDYNTRTNYTVGDVVNYGGNIFRARQDSLGERPDLLDDGSTENSDYWETLIPGISWKGIWQTPYEYRIGDAVTWKGSSYRCIESHLSDNNNRPDDDPLLGTGNEPTGDSALFGTYWAKITDGNIINKLSTLGDLRVFSLDQDGSTIGPTRLPIGEKGSPLKVSSGNVDWGVLSQSANVYYVDLNGVDEPTAGTTPANTWRTIRYACEHVAGPATIFVRTGVFEEILPIRIPAFVALVGDELRSTSIVPANKPISDVYKSKLSDALSYLQDISLNVILEQPIEDLYSITDQVFNGDPAGTSASPIVGGLFGDLSLWLDVGIGSTVPIGTNTITTNNDRLKSAVLIELNKTFLVNEAKAYLEFTDSTWSSPERMSRDLVRCIEDIIYNIQYPGNWRLLETVTFFEHGNDYTANKLSDMFRLQDGTGVRNMTLSGLEGILNPGDTNPITRRPTGGAFAALDPGWGPADASAWVGTKSPYVQNVTTFGEACVGLKVDGDLHNGGNQTIVANDFTQIISDGIGVWCNKKGKSEVVSVFTYYNHIGYMCTDGGKIRGTNGNCSYGRYGALSQGFDTTETPITCSINNKFYEATVDQIFNNASGAITNLFYSNAGQHYTTATATITGSGLTGSLLFNEFRDGGVFEARVLDPGDSSTAGGSGYTISINASQGGDDISIILSGADGNTPDDYRNLRLVVSSGTGVGQYGYIAEYDDTEKKVWVGRDDNPPYIITETTSSGNSLTIGGGGSPSTRIYVGNKIIFTGERFGNIQEYTVYYINSINGNTFTISETEGGAAFGLINETGSMTMHVLGWSHFTPGYPIANVLDTTSNYTIEPRFLFSSPGFSTSSFSMATTSTTWNSIAFGNDIFVAVSSGTENFAYSSDGTTWTGITVGVNAVWNSVKFVNGRFVAVAGDGVIGVSANGSSWSFPNVTAYEFTDIAYGNGKYIITCSGTNVALSSTDLDSFSVVNLPEGADWNAIEYGKGIFVMTSFGDSSSLNTVYSEDGTTWAATTIPGSVKSLAYGNNRFVAIAGGFTGSSDSFISFDGATWIQSDYGTVNDPLVDNWQDICYGQGLFIVVGLNTNVVQTSDDGLFWTTGQLSGSVDLGAISFASISNEGRFVAVGDVDTGITILTGATTKARPQIISNRVALVRIWEPGSGYTSPPTVEVIDNLNTGDVNLSMRTGFGILANPTILNGGVGYQIVSTRVAITGDGYKDEYHLGDEIVVDNLSRLPGPGDNVVIASIDDYVYKLLSVEILTGTFPTATARLRIAKDLDRDESPEHGTGLIIRQQYSQVRLTGHDFLDIGLGNFTETNYPDTLFPIGTVRAPENQVYEENGGRVFYTSTDEDGNFRVGELFAVEQATGTVTLNAQFFQLEGLEEISLGGVTVGGSGVVIREFSTDPLFVADSNNIIPTQRAIKAFLNRRVSGGGADAITGQISAGEISIGPARISTTTGNTIQFTAKANFKGPIDGDWLIQSMFLSGTGEIGE